MVDGRGQWQREHNVACAMLAAGKITDVRRYLRQGLIAPAAPPPVDAETLEFERCLRANGRVMKPEEIAKWLAANPRKT